MITLKFNQETNEYEHIMKSGGGSGSAIKNSATAGPVTKHQADGGTAGASVQIS